MNLQDDEPQIEVSPLSGDVTRDGVTVSVEIYRIAGSAEGWSLEVVDQEGGSTVWDDLFPTDQDAFQEFARTLEIEGIGPFVEPKGRLH